MKKFITILISLFFLSCCQTLDCAKCPAIVKTKTIIPPIEACFPSETFEDLKIQFLSTEDVETEGELYIVITTNTKLMERHIKILENSIKCIEDILKVYKKDTKQNSK